VAYVTVNGLRTWHETSGAGEPAVLLHGGFSGADSWAATSTALAGGGYQVFVPERRGHAHTPDVPGPVSYAVMAQDTIAYLDQEVGGPSHLIGWSDGAVVALLVAQRRPDLARSLVLIGQYFSSSGRVQPGIVDYLATAPQARDFLRRGYEKASPDGPGHFDVVFAKFMEMYQAEPEIDLATLAGVQVPALVMQGDRDDVTLEHSAAVVAALGAGRLAVLPGSHLLPVESPRVVNMVIMAFLRGAPAAAPWQSGLG
jgi:pimeloyl-ACP methyl ester carboxylesterase